MEINLEEIQEDFKKLQELRNQAKTEVTILEKQLNELKPQYDELTNEIKDNFDCVPKELEQKINDIALEMQESMEKLKPRLASLMGGK